MIYIQTAEGLSQVSPSLTKEKIIAALGYTPADNLTFYEDESGVLAIVDNNGYVVAKIGAAGLETVEVSAKAIKLNGQDLAAKLQALEEKSVDIDLSDYALAETVDQHIGDSNAHVTVAEKLKWNSQNTSFSGKYEDLEDAPNLSNSNEEELIVADGDGNVIMRVDAHGLNVSELYINGQPLVATNNLVGKKVSIIGDSISTYSGYLPSGYSATYPTGDVTSVY